MKIKHTSRPAHLPTRLWSKSKFDYTLCCKEPKQGSKICLSNVMVAKLNALWSPPPPTTILITSCELQFLYFMHSFTVSAWFETKRAMQLFRSTQLHPLKENDVPLEVGVCLAGKEMADLGRVIDWKSGVCHSTLVLRGVIHSRLLWEASAAGEK